MNLTIRRLGLLIPLLVASQLGCAAPAADDERAALESAIHRWVTAVNAQDSAVLVETMTADVELTADGRTVAGRDAVVRALIEAARHARLVATTREIQLSGSTARHVATLAWLRKNGDVHAGGEAVDGWKRVNGHWRLYQRIVTVTAPEVSLERPSTKEPVRDPAP
jgi:ketosteroid isomerase-like protein